LASVGLATGLALTAIPLSADPAEAARSRRRLRPRPELVALAAQDPFAAIRQCESGGNYAAVSRSRRYMGAYQFNARTWRGVGMTGLPHEAPPEVQDEAARRLQAARGWKPWPTCSRLAGLR
jgi:hypothetical protein